MTKSLAPAFALGLAVAAAPATAAELKLAHFMSPQHPMHEAVMVPLAEAVEEATDGELTIRIYPAGELGSGPNQQYRRALTGIADIAFNLPQYTPAAFDRSPLLHVPGLFDSPQQATRRIWEEIDALAPDFSEVELLAFWTNNPAMLFTRDTPVRSLADIEGLKIRAPDPVSAQIIEAWGASPVSMSATETYNAMSTGVVDGTLIGASAVGSYNLQEVSDYVTLNVPGALSTFTLIMNQQAYDGLSESQRAALDEASGESLSMLGAEGFAAAGERGLDALRAADVELLELSDEALAEFEAAMAGPINAYLESEGEEGGFDGPAFVDRFRTAE